MIDNKNLDDFLPDKNSSYFKELTLSQNINKAFDLVNSIYRSPNGPVT